MPRRWAWRRCAGAAPRRGLTRGAAGAANRSASGATRGRVTTRFRRVLLTLFILAAAPAPCTSNVPLKRAQCERKAGRPVKALELIDDFLIKRPQDRKALKLREQLAKEVVLIEWFSEPEGATVTLDGEELGPTPITITVDPGKHAFRFTREGYQALERE